MFGVRILLFIVAFLIVIGEFWAGAVIKPDAIYQQAVAIAIGGMVIAMLLSVSIFLLAPAPTADGGPPRGTAVQWVVLIVAGIFIAGVSFFMPTKFLPLLTERELVKISAAAPELQTASGLEIHISASR